MIRITLLALVLVALAVPLSGGWVGPETPLSTPVLDAAPGHRSAPRIASNGREFLVTWREEGLLRAARVDTLGGVRDGEPLVIGSSGGLGRDAVASDGRNYLIAHACGSHWSPRVCLAHLDAETGVVTARRTLENTREVAIASNGRGYLISYLREDNVLLEVAPLRADGTAAGPAYTIGRTFETPELTSNGERYYLVWQAFGQLDGVLVSETGIVGERRRFSEGAAIWSYAVASDGDGFLVIWGRYTAAAGYGIQAVPVSRSGIAAHVRTVQSYAGQEHALAWNGTRYVAAYTPIGAKDVAAFELSASGEVLSAAMPIAASSQDERGSVMAWNGRHTLIAWHARSTTDSAVLARLVTPDGLGDVFAVALGVPSQQSVTAMRKGTRTVVAWDENYGLARLRKVFVQRLDAEGRPLDGRGLPVGDSPRHQVRPALAGSVIAWLEIDDPAADASTGEVWAALLDGSGQPAGAPFRLGAGTFHWLDRVAVADPGGAEQFVFWQSEKRHLMATRIVPSTGTVDPPFRVSDGSFETDPRIANGDGFLAFWHDGPMIAGAFSRSGRPLGPFTNYGYVDNGAAVWNGTAYAAFWSTFHPTEASAQHISSHGFPIGAPQPIGDFEIDDAVWTGQEYRVAFHRFSADPSLWIMRLDRDFRAIASFRFAPQSSRRVALLDDMVIYLAPYGSDARHTRVVARRIGENASMPRRRTVRIGK